MAFASTTNWDVRTTGSNSNGGGFDLSSSGTDYSQQDSPQVTYTDLVIDGTTNTKCTSAGNPFTSAHVGNVINITSGTGFTVQRVQVVSVALGVATCDKALGTLSSTGGNGKLGGALLTIQTALGSAVAVAGNIIHIKSGTYSETLTMNVDSLSLIGYGSSHRDFGTRPLVTTAANTILVNTNSHPVTLFQNINMSATGGTRNDGFSAGGSESLFVDGAILDGFHFGVCGDNGARGYYGTLVLVGVEIKNCTSDGFKNWAQTTLIGCNIHNNTGAGGTIARNDQQLVLLNTIVRNNATGLGSSGTNRMALYCFNSTIANNTGDGIVQSGAGGTVYALVNNVIYGNGGYGVNLNSTALIYANKNNAYGANTTAARLNFSAGQGDVSLSASPFTSSTDLSLNGTAGGGAACKAAGYPGVFPGGVITGYPDIGAVQSTVSASVAMKINPGMSGGIRG